MPDSFDAHWRKSPACFAPLSQDYSPPIPFSSAVKVPPKLLFGRDPYLLSMLLASIGSEAVNRRLAVCAVYDPYLPNRLTALSVEGIGSFTLSPRQLTVEGGLVDCTVSLPEGDEKMPAEARDLATARCALAKEIISVGRLLADAKSLLAAQGSRLTDLSALRAKAERLAKKLPPSQGGLRKLAIQSYGEEGAVTCLPFGNEVQILGLPCQYSLASLFLTELADALSVRGCHGVLLSAAFTGEILGIFLPEMGICYLADASEDSREKELTLSRFLYPFTAEERRCYRRLSASADAIEAHLCHRLAEYRTLAKKEQEVLTALYSESRLQNFRKRLLIDLFCS